VVELLPHVITGKGPCDRPYSAENCSLQQRSFYHAVNCSSAYLAPWNAVTVRMEVLSAIELSFEATFGKMANAKLSMQILEGDPKFSVSSTRTSGC
jgi:hypothetical protein